MGLPNSGHANQHFTVVIPCRNCEDFIERCMLSVITQRYDNFDVMVTDDGSTDRTWELMNEVWDDHRKQRKITLFRNPERRWALYNVDRMVRRAREDTVIVLVDGDDMLSHPLVLDKLNEVYQNPDVWLTYGNCISTNGAKYSFPLHPNTVRENSYRTNIWGISHLKTFQRWLYLKLRMEDLQDENRQWLRYSYDKAMFIPMMEMANGRFQFIPDILYVYNADSSDNVHKVDCGAQGADLQCVQRKPKYWPLEGPDHDAKVEGDDQAAAL